MSKEVLFDIDNIYVRYGKKYILEDFSLKINKGDFFVILGANGSGKSTLIKSLVRVNKINAGSIKYANKYINLKSKITIKNQIFWNKIKLKNKENKLNKLKLKNQDSLKQKIEIITNEIKNLNHIIELDKNLLDNWNKFEHIHSKKLALQISYVPQIQDFPDQTTVYDFVKLGRFPYSNALGYNFDYLKEHEIILKALKQVGIEEFHDKNLNELSGGQRQKALIALTLAQETETIILDEPTNHLDIKSQLEIIELLDKLHKEFNKNIIMIIHDINMGIKYANKILLMKDGKQIALGDKYEVINKQNIKDAFDVDVEIKNDDSLTITEFWLDK